MYWTVWTLKFQVTFTWFAIIFLNHFHIEQNYFIKYIIVDSCVVGIRSTRWCGAPFARKDNCKINIVWFVALFVNLNSTEMMRYCFLTSTFLILLCIQRCLICFRDLILLLRFIKLLCPIHGRLHNVYKVEMSHHDIELIMMVDYYCTLNSYHAWWEIGGEDSCEGSATSGTTKCFPFCPLSPFLLVWK